MRKRMHRAMTLLWAVFAAASGIADEPPRYDGQALYLNHCANCHGVYGEGDGAVTPSLNVVLQDLRYLSQRNGGRFPGEWLVRIIDGRDARAAHGPHDMPVWGTVLQMQEGYDEAANARVAAKIEALVRYLGSMQISGAGDEIE
jgi:mono/diheme cytochrome c family protein